MAEVDVESVGHDDDYVETDGAALDDEIVEDVVAQIVAIANAVDAAADVVAFDAEDAAFEYEAFGMIPVAMMAKADASNLVVALVAAFELLVALALVAEFAAVMELLVERMMIYPRPMCQYPYYVYQEQ